MYFGVWEQLGQRSGKGAFTVQEADVFEEVGLESGLKIQKGKGATPRRGQNELVMAAS